jgi:hypothetical protein
MSNKNKVEYVGNASYGWDGELYITAEDGNEINLSQDLIEKGILGETMGDETKVKITIEKLS